MMKYYNTSSAANEQTNRVMEGLLEIKKKLKKS
jgi:hypothetical protein